MSKKICIVTGANSGIGKEAAKQIAGKGYHVIMACRNEERGRKALETMKKENPDLSLELMLVDMGLKSSIRQFAEEVSGKYPVVEVLIHNAAIFDISQKEPEKNAEGVETIWAANHIGPVYLTKLLLDNLKKSEEGRVITIASKGLIIMPRLRIDLADPEFGKRKFTVTKAYYQSKRAQVMYTYWLADQLKESPVTANCIRVTNVKIDLSRYPDLSPFIKWMYAIKSKKSITPEKMAETYAWLATSPDVIGISGVYFDENRKPVKSVPYTYDREEQKSLMDLTERYLK
ncbi:SDR family NAD(P)-dependent oxidoreductase [Spirochaeta isovalerica]|uniref:NAD(P)-dependent dehydrogenase (Short-subunit alcohol dehydrogenase family) n=1 Tax=Spirochaeta isovalerica TaxID=150 RepID=A0A841R725_9SPIO|nr:SDR family NAD(P)-dependent oxidoreductase [Spirochaeta isovalerica]MBB6479645.1 NAD(P)-dependent dehydrogenase (short-subunit alcohol dehydrogenase family) [Spirochaeta isovalerica]